MTAVGLGDRRHAAAFRDETGIPFLLLVDERREAYRAAGLRSATMLQLASPAVAIAGLAALARGHVPHRSGRNPLQLGGSFVIGQDGSVLLSHVNRTASDHAAPEELLAVLRNV